MNISNQAKFIGAIVLQVLIILIIIIFKVAVLSGGTDIHLSILPVDPRDPLRGDYVTFRYGISEIDTFKLRGDIYSKKDNTPSVGQTVYVVLTNYSDEPWAVKSATINKPADDEIYIKGVVERVDPSKAFIELRYGIEDYYIPEGLGRALNFWNRNSDAYAKVSLDKEGNAVLKQLYIDGQPWP